MRDFVIIWFLLIVSLIWFSLSHKWCKRVHFLSARHLRWLCHVSIEYEGLHLSCWEIQSVKSSWHSDFYQRFERCGRLFWVMLCFELEFSAQSSISVVHNHLGCKSIIFWPYPLNILSSKWVISTIPPLGFFAWKEGYPQSEHLPVVKFVLQY